jgi:hypothetical protein
MLMDSSRLFVIRDQAFSSAAAANSSSLLSNFGSAASKMMAPTLAFRTFAGTRATIIVGDPG